MKVNAIESAMNEISGIELADNVLRNCCIASADKCPQIRCIHDRLCFPKRFSGNTDRNFEDTQATGWQLISYSRSSV